MSNPAAPASVKEPIIINALGFLDNIYGPPKGAAPGGPAATSGARGGADGAISREAAAAARASGLTAVSTTVSISADVAAVDHALDAFDAAVARYDDTFLKVLTAADIRRARAEGKVGLIYNFQDSVMIGDDLSRIDRFHDRGVRVFQLTYNSTNAVGSGSRMPEDMGLTDFGRALVERVCERRAIVDLSHSNRATCLDTIATAPRPPMISHTGCRALVDLPRNKHDDEMRAVAERGGFVGILYLCFIAPGRAYTSEDVVDHIGHAINICGEDHVGFGSDHGVVGIPDMDAQREHYRREVIFRRDSGIGADGEHPDFLPFPDDMIGPDQYRVLVAALERRGYSAARIEKVMGLNFLNYAESIWGA